VRDERGAFLGEEDERVEVLDSAVGEGAGEELPKALFRVLMECRQSFVFLLLWVVLPVGSESEFLNLNLNCFFNDHIHVFGLYRSVYSSLDIC
jgi:hypothetical protein